MRQYSYSGLAALRVITRRVVGLGMMLFATSLAVVFVLGPSATGDSSGTTSFVCLSLWTLLIGWIIGLFFFNLRPTVYVGDEYLLITAFPAKRVTIPWGEVIDIGAGHVRFGGVLLRARRITPAHVIYGWMYSRRLVPAFVIGPDIDGFDDLVWQIKSHLVRTQERD